MTTASSDPVRVPNVHSHAVSGLDHVALGDDDRDALNVSDNTDDLEVSPDTEAVGNVVAPSEDLPDMTGAVASSETTDDTSGSAPDEGTPGGDSPEGHNPSDGTQGDQNAPQEPPQGDGGTGAPGEAADASGSDDGTQDTPGEELTPDGLVSQGGEPVDPATDGDATHDGTED